jgi:hypothetical protein
VTWDTAKPLGGRRNLGQDGPVSDPDTNFRPDKAEILVLISTIDHEIVCGVGYFDALETDGTRITLQRLREPLAHQIVKRALVKVLSRTSPAMNNPLAPWLLLCANVAHHVAAATHLLRRPSRASCLGSLVRNPHGDKGSRTADQ